jgi:hypothetical protein
VLVRGDGCPEPCMCRIGIPAYVFVVMLWGRRKNMLKDPQFRRFFGFLYARYGAPAQRRASIARTPAKGLNKPSCRDHMPKFHRVAEPAFYLWELVFLMRRFAFCVCLVALRGISFAQGVRRSMYRIVGAQGGTGADKVVRRVPQSL